MPQLYIKGAALAAALCLSACGSTDKAAAAGPTDIDTPATDVDAVSYGARARARMVNVSGARIGEAIAWQGRSGVLLQVRVKGLTPGHHGLHLHAVGSCEDAGSYKLSGGHVGKQDGPHGFLHPDGAHAGDLPNIYVAGDGTARVDVFSSLITLADLTDADGAALIIHASRDDYQTQPLGGAGARVACAAF